MTLPRVPWTPEPLAALRARYRQALVGVVDHATFIPGETTPPSAYTRHVFDTEGGVRLIVSIERCADGRIGTHVSASFHGEPPAGLATLRPLLAHIVAVWQSMSGETREPEFLGVSDGAVPHFFLERAH